MLLYLPLQNHTFKLENKLNKLQIAEKFAKSLNYEEIKKVILFGSVARGIDRKKSDIDILIVTTGDRFKLKRRLMDMVFDYFSKFKVYVSLKVISIEDYERLSNTHFISEIKNNGIEI